MPDYKTPDVYVEEISTLPPSVAEVSTAIPAFIGYTEMADETTINIPTRITSLLEFKTFFGGPYKPKFTAKMGAGTGNKVVYHIEKSNDQQHRLYYALDHYFRNGGSDCYIVSLGKFAEKTIANFQTGLDALKTEDEPTLIILSEATTLASTDEYYSLCTSALMQCADLKDRFCIFDTQPGNKSIENFRNNIGINNLKYGAAYYPYLNTTISYEYDEVNVDVEMLSIDLDKVIRITGQSIGAVTPNVEVKSVTDLLLPFVFDSKTNTLTLNITATTTATTIQSNWTEWRKTNNVDFTLSLIGDGTRIPAPIDPTPLIATTTPLNDDFIKNMQTVLYNSIKQELAKLRVILPPSPAVAGIYATTDRERGVWKAPANVSINDVISPTVKISSNDQENMNMSSTGKSINAIRGFLGKGTLVWGARTLAGNDNEWRYVNVRRLFNMIEESTKKASYFAVFEPNTATTWLKVKGMIESFLYRLWQQGALAGPAPKAAYFVNVGLGITMTQQDILEGRMIVEIGIAAVRPAEFIILRFSHKLQEA